MHATNIHSPAVLPPEASRILAILPVLAAFAPPASSAPSGDNDGVELSVFAVQSEKHTK